eukprot:SAG31_NODE_441_length_15661_cov_17.905423_20_plen_116_part_00
MRHSVETGQEFNHENDEEEGAALAKQAIFVVLRWDSCTLMCAIVDVQVPAKVKGQKPITKTKQVPCDSFFNFFSPPDLEELDELREDEVRPIGFEDEAEAEELSSQILIHDIDGP